MGEDRAVCLGGPDAHFPRTGPWTPRLGPHGALPGAGGPGRLQKLQREGVSRAARAAGWGWGGGGGVYSRGGSLGVGSPSSQHPEVGGALRLFGLLDWRLVLWVPRSTMGGRRLPALRYQSGGGGTPGLLWGAGPQAPSAFPGRPWLHRSSARRAAAGVQRSGRPSAGEVGGAAQTKRC